MDIIQALILGIVQGLTEFLPVSSSAHLVFVPYLIGTTSSLAYDTLLHIGTLVAVVAYFWNDIINMLKSFFSSLIDIFRGQFRKGLQEDQFKKLAWFVIIGTIPAGLAGILFKSSFESLFNSVPIVGVFLIITGFLLWGSEMVSRRISNKTSLKEMSLKNSIIIGIAQAFAIAPGISRSGATISAGLFLGVDKELAARYSFLLSIPAILGAALVQAKDIGSMMDIGSVAAIAGFIAAIISGYLAVRFMLKLIKERNLLPFAYYCWIIGPLAIILGYIYHL
ncbi:MULTISPECIES: undecaprenyl-diphosphatase UppP [Methanobacterium]|jgi:undecaprenyl-diphosphatase|uniref:Undecaprenyl-diphosphatase n=1 Tax=Methanobacterium veterum TaxID=408577 RepID=A0A9E5A3Z3_9EURY|nr:MULTISPECIES: undecaprenyl-diphosphatase UppP [Methanobacterium]MCZ3365684.1 undecaprenyl-diphosphatase UppP [Methanobacterium veterum]MCZ3371148.1 undecaprenyl-diphosphatase UppP [Methanobacterium veterum]